MFVEGQRLTLLELLQLFPTCRPPLGHLLSCLPPLMPRYYSVASSPLANPSTIMIVLSVVAYECAVSTEVRHTLCVSVCVCRVVKGACRFCCSPAGVLHCDQALGAVLELAGA